MNVSDTTPKASAPALTVSRVLFLVIIMGIFLGHIMAFGAWWYLSPKGFAIDDPHFWTNTIISPIVISGCLVGIWGVIRQKAVLLKLISPMLPTATIATVITARLLYPMSLRPFFLVPACVWIAFLILLTWIIFRIFKQKYRFTYILCPLILLSAIIGAFLPWSQKSRTASTKPLNQSPPENYFSTLNIPQYPIQLDNNTMLDGNQQRIQIKTDKTNLDIYPVLDFIARSPDRCWTLFAKRSDRIGPKSILSGFTKTSNKYALKYTNDDYSILEVETFEQTDSIHINSFTSINQPVYSHLNAYSILIFEGSKTLSISFSPFENKRFEIAPFDYPFGRPAKFAYLSKKGEFHVVQASNAEKGPFHDLALPEIISKEKPLKITLFEGEKAKYNIILYDWYTQLSTQPSPTAGGGVPINAISFNLVRENPPKAFIHITLGDTSVGRGFDTVGHSAGIYKNHMIIEKLD